jgi:hypothetical protein
MQAMKQCVVLAGVHAICRRLLLQFFALRLNKLIQQVGPRP